MGSRKLPEALEAAVSVAVTVQLSVGGKMMQIPGLLRDNYSGQIRLRPDPYQDSHGLQGLQG